MSKEIEYKALISKEEYEGLLSELSKQFTCRRYVQTNYYYDTESCRCITGMKHYEFVRRRKVYSWNTSSIKNLLSTLEFAMRRVIQ